MNQKLILAGDRGEGKAFKKFLVHGLALFVVGFAICLVTLLVGEEKIRYAWGREREMLSFIIAGFTMIGGICAAAGIAAPFLAIYDAKKCYIDVYENYVSGSRVIHRKGSVDKYEAFQMTYDKITGVAAQKNKVLLYIGSESFECHAFNAEEVCCAIRDRIS